jgi:hypothetical protein
MLRAWGNGEGGGGEEPTLTCFVHHAGPSPPWLVGEVPFMKRLGQPRAFQMWGERHGPGMHSVHLAGLCVLHVNQPETAR